ncbi:unnamed protein product [Orchesella dallaii]|uniref:Uncharacterized protein n=1 Tax=Orchesella dallaii TaxID=48710 RepID=A0ABP1R6L8_9HEXA
MEWLWCSLCGVYLTTAVLCSEQHDCCIFNLFSELREHWELYTFHNRITQIKSGTEFLVGEPSIKIVSYQGAFSFREPVYRYSTTLNIIICPLPSWHSGRAAKDCVLQFMKALVPTRTLFLFVNVIRNALGHEVMSSPNWVEFLPVFPALKVLIYVDKLCDPTRKVLLFICKDYCSSVPAAPSIFDLFRHLNFDSAHRSLFQNTRGKVLPALVADVFQYTEAFKDQTERASACLKLVGQLSKYCRNDIMTMLTIAKYHNATLSLHRMMSKTMATYQVGRLYSHIEHIVYALQLSAPKTPREFAIQFHYEKTDSMSILYCKENDQKNGNWRGKLSPWKDPFTPTVWLTFKLVFIFIIVAFLIDSRTCNGFLAIVQLISYTLGHEKCEKKRYYTFICSMAFLLLIYSNCILSIISVPPPVIGFQTLKNLLDAKYKICWPKRLTSKSPDEMLQFDFEVLGLSNKINTTFHIMENATKFVEIVAEMVRKGNKLAMWELSSTSERKLKELRHEFGLRKISSYCFIVKQTLNIRLYFWKINTENRYWIIRTLERLVESGINSQWNKWSDWGSLVKLKLLNDTDIGGHSSDTSNPTYISLNELLIVFIMWVVLSVVSFFVLCTEIIRCTTVNKF